jgi:acyl dehydratase
LADEDAPRAPIAGADTGWWLEDALPGLVIRHPHGRTIDEAEHVWLAWLTHNLSDLHGDAHRAADGPFGQPLVLGALTASIVIGLAEPAVPTAGLAARTLPSGWASIRLSGPVVAGDTLRAESTIHAVRPMPDMPMGFVTRTITGRDQRGVVVALIEEVERLVPARAHRDRRTSANDC